MPSAAEIKLFIDEAKAAYKANTGKAPGKSFVPKWYFGDGKPLVNAYYLLDMARVFPYAETIYYSENSLTSPLYIEDGMGDALLLPMRNKNNTDEIASNPYIHKPEDVSSTESNVRSYKAPQANETVQALLHETDGQRAERLSSTTLNVAQYDGANESFTEAEAEALEAKTKRDARDYVKTLLKKLGVYKHYANANARLEFDFGANNASESLHKQIARGNSLADFAKMLTSMDAIVENAVPIEIHSDKYDGAARSDTSLDKVYVFLSAFQDEKGTTPVQLEVKAFREGKNNRLYMAVTLKKISDMGLGVDLQAANSEQLRNDPIHATKISISEIISKINPSDGAFLKYIPDSMLSDAQKAAKQSALEAQQNALETAREQAKAEAEQRKMLDVQKQTLYNQGKEADANGGNHGGQLSSASGQADGRANHGVSEQGRSLQGRDSGNSRRPADNTQGTLASTGAVAASNRQGNSGSTGLFLSQAGRDNLSAKGVTDLHLESSDADLQRFSNALDAGKATNSRGAYVDSQSVESLQEKGAKTFLSPDGMAGVAIGTHGEESGNIFAVFKSENSTAKKASAELVITAIANGGNKLDNFDGSLSKFYSRLGFIPVARVPFNTDYMPSGWNLEQFSTPDVIFWMHNGDSADTVAKNFGNNVYHEATDADMQALPVFDGENGYSEAWAYRDGLLAQREAEQNQEAAAEMQRTEEAAAEMQREEQNKAKPDGISTYRASGQAVTPNSVQPTGTPKRSPAQIAKRLADALKTGYSVGTRKIRQMPAAVQGIYENRARQIAVRSKKAGSYVVTMHETFHGLSERLGMVGNQQMTDNLDPAFAQAYTAAELPGEAFAEFGWRYMQSDELARSFAGDAYVDAFESAIRREGIADAVHQAARDMRMWLNATTNERIGAIVHDQSEKRDNRGWRQRFSDLIARNVDDTAAAEGVAKEVRKQSGKNKIDLSEDIRSNALMKNFSDRQAWNLLCGGGQTEIGDSLATRFEKAGLKAEDAPLLYSYMLALHSLDRDTQNKPVFDESITTDDRQALIRDVQTNHPEVAAAEQAFQAFRTELLQYFLVDSGRMTQAELDALNKMYPHYVPTMRVKEPPHNSTIPNRVGGSDYLPSSHRTVRTVRYTARPIQAD